MEFELPIPSPSPSNTLYTCLRLKTDDPRRVPRINRMILTAVKSFFFKHVPNSTPDQLPPSPSFYITRLRDERFGADDAGTVDPRLTYNLRLTSCLWVMLNTQVKSVLCLVA